MSFAFVFPGQGSQSVGMMAAYGDAAVVRATFDEASAALGDDLWAMVADGPAEVLTQTVNTQPVMLTAAYAMYRAWLAEGGAKPAFVAGHSLGEYTALVAAGVIAFKDAVPTVPSVILNIVGYRSRQPSIAFGQYCRLLPSIAATVSGVVARPRMTSTSTMTGTGLKK